ncbi:MAG: DUF3801 domain-containing protein [Ruminococcus sp.]|nr:DUF3801 domain-containing protein [Ruminococcus sp.]
MSEISETMQIVELVGRGAFKLGEVSIQAIQFLFQLAASKQQMTLRLEYGEMSMDKLLEKQALMGDESAMFQVHTQDPKELSDIKKELSERGISFCQLPDYDNEDGFTQFYSIGSDAAKLNAFFKAHESLGAGSISLDDYYNTVPDEKKEELREEINEASKEAQDLKKSEFDNALNESPLILNSDARVIGKEINVDVNISDGSNNKESPYLEFRLTNEHHVLLPNEEVEEMLGDEGTYSFRPDITKEYTLMDEDGITQDTITGEQLFREFDSGRYDQVLKKVHTMQQRLQKQPDLSDKNNGKSQRVSRENMAYRNNANRLSNDAAYKELLRQPGSREITLNEELVKGTSDTSITFRVPGTQGKLLVAIPKEHMRLIDGGQTYTAVIDRKKEYQVLDGGQMSKKTGEEIQIYFNQPRKNLQKAKVVKNIGKDAILRR